ncbi:MAG: HEAT repeat domain-containing protein [Anaerolineales bacterium]|nr:HEAT repeat domain-containing protein [Anaerolineales bacterium]
MEKKKSRGCLLFVTGFVVLIFILLAVAMIPQIFPDRAGRKDSFGEALPQPTPWMVSEQDGEPVTSICLRVEESYPDLDESQELSVLEGYTVMLTAAGFEVKVRDCETELDVQVVGEAVGTNYTSSGSPHYASTRYSGIVVLHQADLVKELEVVAEGPAPETISADRFLTPEDAPFDEGALWFVYKSIEGLWGPDSILPAFTINEETELPFSFVAEEYLNEMGVASIPVLIRGTRNPEAKIREESARMLGRLHRDAEVVVPALTALLADPHQGEGPHQGECLERNSNGNCYPYFDVRSRVVQALGAYKEEAFPAVPALLQLLEEAAAEQSETEMELLVEGLEEISGESFEDPADWQAWWVDTQGS